MRAAAAAKSRAEAGAPAPSGPSWLLLDRRCQEQCLQKAHDWLHLINCLTCSDAEIQQLFNASANPNLRAFWRRLARSLGNKLLGDPQERADGCAIASLLQTGDLDVRADIAAFDWQSHESVFQQ